MPNQNDLVIQISAQTALLQDQLRAAEQRLDALAAQGQNTQNSVQHSMSSMGGAARSMGGAVAAGVAAATAALGLLGVNALETSRILTQAAAKTGMSAEALQYYAQGAKQVGVEQADLADIFKDVQDRIGDFLNTGGGEMVDFFEQIAPKIGVTAEQFRHLSGAEGLQLFYDSLQKANLSQNEMTFQLEAVASNVTVLQPLLKNGGEGFKYFGDQAQAAGAILTNDMVKATQELQIEINLMKNQLDGAANTIQAKLTPVFRDLIGAFNDTAKNGDDVVVISEYMAESIRHVALVAVGAVAAFDLFGKALGTFGGALQGVDIENTMMTNMMIIGANIKQSGAVFTQGLDDIAAQAEVWATRMDKIKEAGMGPSKRNRPDLGLDASRTNSGLNVGQAKLDKTAADAKAKKDAEAKAAADKAKAEAERLAAAKEAGLAWLAQIDQLGKSELELLNANEAALLAEADKRARAGEVSATAAAQAKLDIAADFEKQRETLLIGQALKVANAEGAAHEAAMAAAITRADELRVIDKEQRALTEEGRLLAIDEEFTRQQELLLELREAEFISMAEFEARKTELIKAANTDRLNAVKEGFEGQRALQEAFQEGNLQGALQFFASDFGGLSKHSRKMFEVQKAAKTALVALSIPEAVSDAFNAGNRIAGPKLGLAYGAAALAVKLGQLRDIQSATYGGKGGGGGGSGSVGSSAGGAESTQQPLAQRFVNISMTGGEMYSSGQVRELITRLNEEVQNGAVLRVV